MKLSSSKQEPIVALLTRIYFDIHEIEEEFNLLAGEGDFRPRIEYFHDAVRAFVSQDPMHREPGGRLSVELLAYDVSCLRYLHSRPLSSFKPHGRQLSPRTDLVPAGGSSGASRRPDRHMRERISELYQYYAVLFAALLKPLADADCDNRSKDLNHDVEDIHTVIQQLEGLSRKGSTSENIAWTIQHLEEADLQQELLAFMQKQKFKRRDETAKMVQDLKRRADRKDKEIAAIEAAHMNYVMAQLGIFEGSKEVLKKMAAQGMNLIGKFVENAMAESRRQMGR